jgi:tetratricopeptide (TPR) repeat protein
MTNDRTATSGGPTEGPGSTDRIAVEASVAEASAETIEGDDATDVPLGVVERQRYTVGGEHARGGLGRVLRARDRRLGRPVAIKELLHRNDSAEARFVREARITARLQHPGVVPIYEAGQWPDGKPFYAMKLVAGKPLSDVIAERPQLAQRLALLPKLLAVAETIAYAHSLRIVHRDLKPSNVLIGEYGETVVIDWGLAKGLDDHGAAEEALPDSDDAPAAADEPGLTVAGQILGTPSYMSPEQARGEAVDERADVYALGGMLYHLLAGVSPYRAGVAPGAPLRGVLDGPPRPLAEVCRGAPRDLVAIADKAMARDPAARYPDARALAADLARFTGGQLVAAHHYGIAGRLFRFVRRHRVAVSAAGAALAIVAVTLALSVRRVIAERDVAQSHRQAAEGVINFMIRDQYTSLDKLGKSDLIEATGRKVVEYYDKVAPYGLDTQGQTSRSFALHVVATAARQHGDFAESERFYRAGMADHEALFAAATTLKERVRQLEQIARGHLTFSMLAFEQGDGKRAAAEAWVAGMLVGPLAPIFLDNARLQHCMASIHLQLSDAAVGAKDFAAARDNAHRASIYLDGIAARGTPNNLPAGTRLDSDQMVARMREADAMQELGDVVAAAEIYQKVSETVTALATASPDDWLRQWDLAFSLANTAEAWRDAGDPVRAEVFYRRADEVTARLVAHDPTNRHWRTVRRATLEGGAELARERGDLARARALEQALSELGE